MHGRSRMTIDPRIPTMPGRSTSGFHQPGRHCLTKRPTVPGWSTSGFRNNIRAEEEQLPVVARTKQPEEDNCCFTDKNNTKKRKRIPAYTARGEGNKGANKKKTKRKDDSKSLLLSLSRSPH